MQNKLTTIKYSLFIFLLWLYSCHLNEEVNVLPLTGKNVDVYRLLTVQKDNKDNGNWGYIIFRNDDPIIYQFSVPALEGNKPFKSKEAATTVGKLVVDKLNNGVSPSINKKDLDSLGIMSLNIQNEK